MDDKKIKYKLKIKWKLLIIFIVLFTIIFAWARFVEPKRFIVKEYKIINNSLPDSFYGLKVVHFSDLHYGTTINKKELAIIVDKINLTKPDIVIFTGDLVDKNTEMTRSVENNIVNELKRIDSTYGNYFVSGNHDKYFSNFEKIMGNSNFMSLNDDYDIIYSSDFETIFIGGTHSEVSKKPSITNIKDFFNTEENIPNYKIFAMHIPDNIKYIKELNFDLVLSGHSHNGQIRLPFIGSVIRPQGAKKYHNEYYRINKTDLYISSGIGTSNLNLRLLNKPSFNLYRIVNK